MTEPRKNAAGINRRLGHGSPMITLGVYGHLFANTDDRAAAVVEAAYCKASLEPGVVARGDKN